MYSRKVFTGTLSKFLVPKKEGFTGLFFPQLISNLFLLAFSKVSKGLVDLFANLSLVEI